MDDAPLDSDLDGLVRRLNESARGDGAAEPLPGEAEPYESPPHDVLHERSDWMLPRGGADGRERLSGLLELARGRQATDLFLVAGCAPVVRLHDQLRPLNNVALDAQEIENLAAAVVPPERRRRAARAGSVDLSFTLRDLGRFRCNVHRERGQWAMAIRLFPAGTPTLASLELPPELGRLAELRHGLVLVTGPTGAGKSTTLAALLGLITANRRVHVVTIEDPVEYEHRQGMAVVEQIEIGRDAPSFAVALRSALRQDPDVLFVGEMRDPESVAIVLTAAETGHLVFSTLHTGDASQSVSRIIDAHPSGQVNFVRAQLAASLAAIVSQQLLPRASGSGRVPAVELLLCNDAMRNLIQKGQLEQIKSQIALGRSAGMRTFDQSLAELVRKKLVDVGEARARARHAHEFELYLRG